MATLKEVLKRMWLRPNAEVPDWLRAMKKRGMTLDSIAVEIRSAIARGTRSCRSAVPVRLAETRAERNKRVRAVFAQYPELSFETVARGKRLGYSDDTMLALRSAAIGDMIRQGRTR